MPPVNESDINRTVCVQSLARQVTKSLLAQLFTQMGPISEVTLLEKTAEGKTTVLKEEDPANHDAPKDRGSNQQRFAFIVFKHSESVLFSIDCLQDVCLFDTAIRVMPRNGSVFEADYRQMEQARRRNQSAMSRARPGQSTGQGHWDRQQIGGTPQSNGYHDRFNNNTHNNSYGSGGGGHYHQQGHIMNAHNSRNGPPPYYRMNDGPNRSNGQNMDYGAAFSPSTPQPFNSRGFIDPHLQSPYAPALGGQPWQIAPASPLFTPPPPPPMFNRSQSDRGGGRYDRNNNNTNSGKGYGNQKSYSREEHKSFASGGSQGKRQHQTSPYQGAQGRDRRNDRKRR